MWRGRGAMLIQLFCLSSPSQPSPGSPAPNTCSEPTDLAQPTSWPDRPKIWPNQIRFVLPKPTSDQKWLNNAAFGQSTLLLLTFALEPVSALPIGYLTSHCFPNLHLIRGNTLEFVPVKKASEMLVAPRISECFGLGLL